MSAPKLLNGLTLKQNRFCREFMANDGNATAAYRHAYNTENMAEATINSEASRLLANPSIAARIEELEIEAAAMAETTPEALIAKLIKAENLAYETNNSAAATGAIMAQGKLAGLIVDKREGKLEVARPSDKPDLAGLLDHAAATAKPAQSVADSAIDDADDDRPALTH